MAERWTLEQPIYVYAMTPPASPPHCKQGESQKFNCKSFEQRIQHILKENLDNNNYEYIWKLYFIT
jgi:hypothetical protein